MIKQFRTKIIDRKLIAENTTQITFDLSGIDFDFVAGQYVTVTLPQLSELPIKEQFRDFSIASSPNENTVLRVTIRHSKSAFKKLLLSQSNDIEILIDGPKGAFTLGVEQTNVVLIAGGIGITPFFSIINDAINTKNERQIDLLYFNTSAQRATYLPELELISRDNSNMQLTNFYGDFDEKHISEFLAGKDYANIPFYVAGPPAMVAKTRACLSKSFVKNDMLKTEEFTGY